MARRCLRTPAALVLTFLSCLQRRQLIDSVKPTLTAALLHLALQFGLSQSTRNIVGRSRSLRLKLTLGSTYSYRLLLSTLVSDPPDRARMMEQGAGAKM